MTIEELIGRMKKDCAVRGTAHRNRFSHYRHIHVSIGLPAALLATLSGSLATINADHVAGSSYTTLEVISLVIAWTVALLTAANSFINPHQSASGHRDKATAYDVLSGKIDKAEVFSSGEKLRDELEHIDAQIEELKVSEPILSDGRILKTEGLLKARGIIS